MSSVLVLTAVLFFGYVAYVIGAQIISIKNALKSEEVVKEYKRENDGFAVVRLATANA